MAWSTFNLPYAINVNPPGGSCLETNNSSPIANSPGNTVSKFPFTAPDHMNGHAIASYSPEYYSDPSTVLVPPQFTPLMGHNTLQGNFKRHGDFNQLEEALPPGYEGLNDSILASVPSTNVLSTHQDNRDQSFEDSLIAYSMERKRYKILKYFVVVYHTQFILIIIVPIVRLHPHLNAVGKAAKCPVRSQTKEHCYDISKHNTLTLIRSNVRTRTVLRCLAGKRIWRHIFIEFTNPISDLAVSKVLYVGVSCIALCCVCSDLSPINIL